MLVSDSLLQMKSVQEERERERVGERSAIIVGYIGHYS